MKDEEAGARALIVPSCLWHERRDVREPAARRMFAARAISFIDFKMDNVLFSVPSLPKIAAALARP